MSQTASFTATELLGRPTDRSVSVNAMATEGVEAYFEYGVASGAYTGTTAAQSYADGVVESVIDGLSSDTRYYYRLVYRTLAGDGAWVTAEEHTFHTQRSTESSFVFTIQSDSHQGYAAFYDATLYERTLGNVLADAPDFHFDLGDTFSLDGNAETVATVRQKYLDQRTAFDRVAHSAPIFLVLGNHENEEGWNLDDKGADLAAALPVLGANARKRYFLNPVPDAFYTGNEDASVTQIDGDHLKEDYYAFEWGDALFVAIDPFWYTMTKPYVGSLGGEQDDEAVGDRWDWTLGEEQYQWLRETLENSRASFKFVFAHHMTGGTADYSRGGAEGAVYGEWGGQNPDGSWGFDDERPGWDLPVHDLLVENGVTIFFHGHDHVFAMEELDGIVYQECPHAANEVYGFGFPSNQTDYDGGHLEENSGHIRVSVTPSQVVVDYVRAFLDGDGENGSVAYSYTIDKPITHHDPVANGDHAATDEDESIRIAVLANDSDADGDTLAIESVSQPEHGATSLTSGRVRYQPDADYCDETESDEFSYTVSDGNGGTATGRVTVEVTCMNDAPVAADDRANTLPRHAVSIDVVANDTDVDDELSAATPTLTREPAHGEVTGGAAGTFTYTPTPGFTGDDSFAYQICDGAGLCDDATVEVVTACAAVADCDDGNACTVDACNRAGDCSHGDLDCDDGNACTVDSCDPAHGCARETLDCDDENPCTDDACDPSGGCTPIANAASCDDGDPCTTDDTCSASVCRGSASACGDGSEVSATGSGGSTSTGASGGDDSTDAGGSTSTGSDDSDSTASDGSSSADDGSGGTDASGGASSSTGGDDSDSTASDGSSSTGASGGDDSTDAGGSSDATGGSGGSIGGSGGSMLDSGGAAGAAGAAGEAGADSTHGASGGPDSGGTQGNATSASGGAQGGGAQGGGAQGGGAQGGGAQGGGASTGNSDIQSAGAGAGGEAAGADGDAPSSGSDSGCGCALPSSASPLAAWLSPLLLGAVASRRRSKRHAF